MISKAVISLMCKWRSSIPNRPRERARNMQLPSPITASGTCDWRSAASYNRRSHVAAASGFPGCSSELLGGGRWTLYVRMRSVSVCAQLSRCAVDTAVCSLKPHNQMVILVSDYRRHWKTKYYRNLVRYKLYAKPIHTKQSRYLSQIQSIV